MAGMPASLARPTTTGSTRAASAAHGDDRVVGSTFDDVLTGNDGAQSLFGNAGIDRADGLGGDDVVNGGTDDDELYGGAGDDRVEGSAGGDYIEGGAGEDIFEGDNVCETEPCTGDSDFIQARDGQADTVNCGVGADTAIVDSLDVVAQDTQHGCERIDRSAAEAVTPPAGGVLGVTATGLGVPRLSVLGARKLGRLKRGKLSIRSPAPAPAAQGAPDQRPHGGGEPLAHPARRRHRDRAAEDEQEGAQAPRPPQAGHDDAGRRRDRRPGPHHDPGPGPALPPLAATSGGAYAAPSRARGACFRVAADVAGRPDTRAVAGLAAQDHDPRRVAARRAET